MKRTRTTLTLALFGALQLLACTPAGSGKADAGGMGTAGTSGAGGTGAGGASGSGGAAGTSGTTGQAGTSGGGGAAGTTGAAGSAGAAGTAGSAGGSTGSGGTAAAGRGGGGGTAAGGRGGSSAGAGGTGPDGGRSDGATDATGDAGSGYAPCPSTAGAACAVMPLGDSITEGYPANTGGYRVELFRQAVTGGKNLTFVGTLMNGPTTVANKTFPQRHEGRRGYTIDTGGGNNGISGQVVDQAIAGQHPQIVLLMIGTNDINRNVDVANAPTRLGKLLDEIITDAPSALLVVSTIIPIGDDAAANTRVQTYNAALPALVSTRAAAGKHVVFLDGYAAFTKDANYRTTLMADSLHPNDAGYVVLGRALYGAISAYLPPGP